MHSILWAKAKSGREREKGAALILVLLIFAVFAAAASGVLAAISLRSRLIQNNFKAMEAVCLAEGGIEAARLALLASLRPEGVYGFTVGEFPVEVKVSRLSGGTWNGCLELRSRPLNTAFKRAVKAVIKPPLQWLILAFDSSLDSGGVPHFHSGKDLIVYEAFSVAWDEALLPRFDLAYYRQAALADQSKPPGERKWLYLSGEGVKQLDGESLRAAPWAFVEGDAEITGSIPDATLVCASGNIQAAPQGWEGMSCWLAGGSISLSGESLGSPWTGFFCAASQIQMTAVNSSPRLVLAAPQVAVAHDPGREVYFSPAVLTSLPGVVTFSNYGAWAGTVVAWEEISGWY